MSKAPVFLPPERFDTISEYIFWRLNKVVKEVEHVSGRPVLNFSIGTPDVPPSSIYMHKLQNLVESSAIYRYPGYGAAPEFTSALQKWYLNRFDVKLQANELLPLCGAKDGIAHLPLALLNAGDQILVPNPGYPAFSGPAAMVGAQPIYYDLDESQAFKINYEEITQKLSKNTRYIWVNFPSNPTGQVMTLPELTRLVAFARAHHLFVLYDNAYSEITFGGYRAPSILEVAKASELAIEIGSFSKSYSFAGLRMGWIVGNPAIINALALIKSQVDSGLALPLQHLGAYVLEHPDDRWHSAMIKSYQMRRDSIAKHLINLGLSFSLPQASLYIWARLPEDAPDAEEYCMHMLKTKHILFAPGSAFGSNGIRYVRVSIGVSIDHIEEYF